MKDNTITTVDGVEVYTSQITEIADRYISDLEDKESIYVIRKIKVQTFCFYHVCYSMEMISTLQNVYVMIIPITESSMSERLI